MQDGYYEGEYDEEGYDESGYDRQGYDREGYDMYGYDRQGYDRKGYDRYGFMIGDFSKGNPEAESVMEEPKRERLIDKKDEVKVDSFVFKPYYSLDKVTHGSEDYYSGYCLVEYNKALYLADVLREEISTDEGTGYELSGMGEHSYLSDITEELGMPWISEAYVHAEYMCMDNLKRINQDGTLAEEVDEELLKKISDYKLISVSTDDAEYFDEDRISINPDMEERFKDKADIMKTEDTVTISRNNIPYGKINARLVQRENKTVLHMDGEEYDIEELLENLEQSKRQKRTIETSSRKQELIDKVLEQQRRIEEQQAELSKLENVRGLEEYE